MNKKLSLTLLILSFVTVLLVGHFFTTKKEFVTTQLSVQEEVNVQNRNSIFENMGLPEGSYVFEYDTCAPTPEHYQTVMKFYQEELETGDLNQSTYIKNVYEKSGEIYIDTDYFETLSMNDGGCRTELESDSRPECNPNGFLDINNNSKIRTFKLSPEVKIRLLEEFGTIPDLHTVSPYEFMTGKSKFGQKYYVYTHESSPSYYIPFQIILKNNEIVFIHQIYRP